MKRVIALCIFFLAFFVSHPLFGEELKWESSLEGAFQESVKTQKPLMVMVESESCRWCKKMKEQTLSDEQIGESLQKFIIVLVDREKVSSEFIPYAQYVPTIYFMTPDKKIINRVVGYFDISDFKSWLEDVDVKLGKKIR